MGTVKLGGLSLPFPIQLPYLVPGKCNTYLNCIRSTTQSTPVKSALSVDEIPPNAMRQASEPRWSSAGFSLGVDLGLSRTGLAISKGFAFRPLMVLELRGQKLEDRLVHIAQKQEVDEFIVGLPLSSDGKETPQSNKVRSIAGWKIEVLPYMNGGERKSVGGWRVYLQDEYGTSTEAMNHMVTMGLNRSTRKGKLDAYAAVMLLERYFSMAGDGVELVVPKQSELQIKLRKASSMRTDIFQDGFQS
ncbi:unnamed protein product [Cuscuta epithymum]|uniref:YqgF/RNase H-like domain-containing protein n=1 Tax=Cuscuta epithymum TaxID=186058 RepID=A0AAV0ETN2_9ASTE|nr:unnamed protein product [Cuscuta epithymum]CAH9126626.1 unnamed protein product [Cuscuta epithymum]